MPKRANVRIARKRPKVQLNAVYQDLIVANPRNLRRQMNLRFLVDTGASGTTIPRKIAEDLDLESVGKGLIELADGRRIKTDLAYLYLKINSDHVFTLASYDGCNTPLLGFDVMNLLGLQVDLSKKQLLKPVRRFSLLNFVLSKIWIGSRRRKRV